MLSSCTVLMICHIALISLVVIVARPKKHRTTLDEVYVFSLNSVRFSWCSSAAFSSSVLCGGMLSSVVVEVEVLETRLSAENSESTVTVTVAPSGTFFTGSISIKYKSSYYFSISNDETYISPLSSMSTSTISSVISSSIGSDSLRMNLLESI